MPEQTPELILLSEAVILTGRNESTIRRFFKKPANKAHTQTIEGRVYVDKVTLLKQYPAPETRPAAPEPSPEQKPGTPEQAPERVPNELIDLLKSQIEELRADKAMLKQQLEIKDRQLARADERTNYLLLQSNNHQPEAPEQPTATPEPTPEQAPEENPRGWWSRLFS